MVSDEGSSDPEATARLALERRQHADRVQRFLASRPRSITVDTACDVEPPVRPSDVLLEATYETFDLWTSRIATFRRREREAWLVARWEWLASPLAVWLFPELHQRHDDRWIRLGLARDGRETMAWLASTFDHTRSMFLSDDGARFLSFAVIPGLDFVHASEHRIVDLREIQAARTRLHELLVPLEPRYLRPPRPPLAPRWPLDRVFCGEPTTTLPLSATPTRRDAWLRDCSARLTVNLDPFWRDQRHVSLGARSAAPWMYVVDSDGLLVPALWNDGRLERILVATYNLEQIVGIRVEGDRYAAYARTNTK